MSATDGTVLPILQAGAARLGVALDDAQIAAFERYRNELLAWTSERANLTAVRDPQEVESLLFLDSLTVVLALGTRKDAEELAHRAPQAWSGPAPSVPEGAGPDHGRFQGGAPPWRPSPSPAPTRLLDIGSGGGFPGLPLKIAFPALDVTLVEATGKKARFLQHAVEALGLHGVQVVTARSEDLAHGPAHRDAYDVVTARAVGHVRVLAELCLPFARVGGLVVAPKGEDADREAAEALHALGVLGGRLRGVVSVGLPQLPPGRRLVVLEKAVPTPLSYPRRAGIPAKDPL